MYTPIPAQVVFRCARHNATLSMHDDVSRAPLVRAGGVHMDAVFDFESCDVYCPVSDSADDCVDTWGPSLR